jgi:hypothetical protein
VIRALIALALVAGMAVAVVVVESLATVIYPGSLRWTAPLLCPDDKPDSFVVRIEQADSEGTSTSFSLFCMGDRGEFEEVGTWKPLGILFLYGYGLMAALLGAVLLGIRRRRRRRDPLITPRPFTPL